MRWASGKLTFQNDTMEWNKIEKNYQSRMDISRSSKTCLFWIMNLQTFFCRIDNRKALLFIPFKKTIEALKIGEKNCSIALSIPVSLADSGSLLLILILLIQSTINSLINFCRFVYLYFLYKMCFNKNWIFFSFIWIRRWIYLEENIVGKIGSEEFYWSFNCEIFLYDF